MENGNHKIEIFLIAFAVIFSGCGGTPTLDLSSHPAPINIIISPSTPAASPVIDPASTATTTTTTNSIQNLKYYKMTQTVSVPALDVTYTVAVGSNKVTFSGYCMTYLKNRYCWDDGIKTVTFKNPKAAGSSMNGQYTYWSMSTAPNMFGTQTTYSYSGLGYIQPDDLMSSAKLINQGSKLESMVETNDMAHTAAYGIRNVDQLIANGVEMSAQCVDNGKILSCGSFSIDLTQEQL